MESPSRLFGLAAVLAAALLVWTGLPPRVIGMDQAADHEGDRVRVSGEVTATEAGASGGVLRLTDGAAGLVVRLTGPPPDDAVGRWVTATGRLVVEDGLLVLQTDAPLRWTS